MRFALLFVVTVGVLIGLALPMDKPGVAVPVIAAVAPVASEAATSPTPTVLERSAGGHFYALAEVNGQPVRFMVDTGASAIALTEGDARRAGIAFDPARFEPVARGVSGLVQGQEVVVDRILLDGKGASGLRGMVIAGGEQSLLGQNYLRNLTIEVRGDRMTLR